MSGMGHQLLRSSLLKDAPKSYRRILSNTPQKYSATQSAMRYDTTATAAAAAARVPAISGSTPPPYSAGGVSFGGIGQQFSTMGSGIMSTITSLLPLAIKIIIAVIILKIVFGLLRGRR